MGIKNAGKAKIKKNLGKAPTKETVDTPISECEAENPLNCRFHGLQALEQQLSALLPAMGYNVPFGTDKLQGGKGFEIRIDGNFDVNQGEFKQSLTNAFKKQGWDITYNGKIEGAGHSFYLKKGNGKNEKPSDKDNADIVDSSNPPNDEGDIDKAFGDDLDALLEEAELEEPTLKKDPFEGLDDTGLTDEEVKEFLAKNGITEKTHHRDEPFSQTIADWKSLIENGKTTYGAEIEDFEVDKLKEFYDAAGPDNKAAKYLWGQMAQHGMVEEEPAKSEDFDLMEFIGNPEKLKGSDMSDFDALLEEDMGDFDALLAEEEGEADETPTWEEIKDFLIKANLAQNPAKTWMPIVLEGKFPSGNNIDNVYKKKFSEAIAKLPSDNKVVKAIKKWMDGSPKETKDIKGIEEKWDGLIVKAKDKGLFQDAQWVQKSSEILVAYDKAKAIGDTDAMFDAVYNLKEAVKDTAATIKEKVEGAVSLPKIKQPSPEPVAQQESATPSEELSEIMGGLDESLMKPLEHDESKFPQNLTQKELDAAIAKGKKAGGHGGLHTTIIEIGGKNYICKNGAGKKSNIIKNGFNADMAYRAGGIYAPDAKLYEFGDGKTYKLSEFLEGQMLIDVWKKADETKREEIRKELLKGYPLDALFSNYDVLGTSPEESQTVTITGADGKPLKTHVAFDNIIIGKDGHAYRIDNDGAFAMTGTGGHKSSSGGSYTVPVEAEHWDNWDERQWIDDFRTLRRNEKNLGIFDRYTTADIFLAAGNINLDNAVSSLPKQLQKALAKPLFEMKQMTYRAVNIALGGYKNNGFVSMALDASYEASKKGLREQCQANISWNDSGFGQYKKYWGNYQPQPFGEKPPEPPQDPTQVLSEKLKNEEYTGGKIGTIILNAAKTINHHGGVKQKDKDGNVLGNGTAMSKPDYAPNAAKIAEWEKIDREKLEELAKTDDNAKTLLGLYDTIAYSKENGWKKPIGQIPSGLVIKSTLDSDFKSTAEKKILEDMAGAIAEFTEKQKKYKKELIAYEKRKSEHKKKEEEKAKAAGGSPYHNFHHFADALMEEGINTDGIAHKVKTNGIQPIENSMASQKGSSYGSDAVKWKVREMMALGYSPEEILKMAEDNKLYNGSYYTSCINNKLLPDKENWARDMNSQAMYLGMNMVKMENENSDLYDKSAGVVFLNRNIGNTPEGLTEAEQAIYNSDKKTGWVGPHVDSAADCMQFEKNTWAKPKRQVYAVPFSRIVCCANNDKAEGGEYKFNGENEYVGNLYRLPCWVYHDENNLTWKNAIDKAKDSAGMKGLLKKFATRLGAFNTLLSQKKQ